MRISDWSSDVCSSELKAFDKYLFSLTDDHRVVLSEQLRKTKDEFLQQIFLSVDDKRIALPDKFAPEPEFLARHRDRLDRTIVVEGKRVSVSVDHGGSRNIKKKRKTQA